MSILTKDLEVSEELETTKTYKISNDKIQGYTDNLDALKQAIYKVLNTEKYEHQIYSFSYGIELESLIGKDTVYVKSELIRRITECLRNDDRIQSIENFRFKVSGDNMLCSFEVASVYGMISITKEVAV